MIRIALPYHLQRLANVAGDVMLEVATPVTAKAILEAIENRFPMLRGTIRDQVTLKRRPMLRFFACEEDISHESEDAILPNEIASGKEPFMIVGAIAGG